MDFALASALGINNPGNAGNNNAAGQSFWTTPPGTMRETSLLSLTTVTSALSFK